MREINHIHHHIPNTWRKNNEWMSYITKYEHVNSKVDPAAEKRKEREKKIKRIFQ